MAEETLPKWKGKAMAVLKRSTPDQIWPFLEEFCNLDRLLPDIHTCYRVEGSPGQPGLVRHCIGKFGWVNEKLLTIDPTNWSLSYQVLENNFGLNNYVATLKVLPTAKLGDDGKPAGCEIEWSFITDPVQGMKLEDFVSYIDNGLQFMANKMEDALNAQMQRFGMS
ncbi:hypothetical protein Golax_015780 [Gossypium laxum]|uniref:Lachrymatory-factor synthase n=1 Tax=Gossypium laxum TaxID=34288 RepID=A0A7J8YWQ8_9ROSI|nr:hypothetical protein [Gossypium laxum]